MPRLTLRQLKQRLASRSLPMPYIGLVPLSRPGPGVVACRCGWGGFMAQTGEQVVLKGAAIIIRCPSCGGHLGTWAHGVGTPADLQARVRLAHQDLVLIESLTPSC